MTAETIALDGLLAIGEAGGSVVYVGPVMSASSDTPALSADSGAALEANIKNESVTADLNESLSASVRDEPLSAEACP